MAPPHTPHPTPHHPPCLTQAEPKLHWLDFFDQLLSPDGEALADGLALDGTHLHPSYVSLLEAALPQ